MTSWLTKSMSAPVHAFRAFLKTHFFAAAALIALALAMRILVPGGFMPTSDDGRIVVALCSGSGPATVVIDLGQDNGEPDHKSTADATCAFTGLGSPSLGGADPVLLVLAVAFAMLLTARAAVPLASVPLRLRPPLRGPPLTA